LGGRGAGRYFELSTECVEFGIFCPQSGCARCARAGPRYPRHARIAHFL